MINSLSKDIKYIFDNIDNKHFINNLNKYIDYISKKIVLDEEKKKYIIYLTLYQLDENTFKKELNEKDYKNIFMKNYNNNIQIINKKYKIKKLSFEKLINIINTKKRTHIYFENIDKSNIDYYHELFNINII